MGSSKIMSNFKSSGSTVVTLCDWIGKVRCKKREARRKCRDLRVVAVLTTALQRAELEMRQKQQERAARWADLHLQVTLMNEAESTKRKQEMDELWRSDFNGLNNFINDLNQIKTAVVR